jgi:D-glycero-alpha-D-manno-heptose 1-phosphate guanylyltransferase
VEAIILVGGLGTRLKDVLRDIPKSMALLNNQPFLNYIFNYLNKNNIRKAILATGYLHDKIRDYYGNSYKDIKIEYSVESKPLGTGGAIKKALGKACSENVLIMNGDTFFDVNIAEMMVVHQSNHADLTMALKPMNNILRYGIVKIDNSRVISFEEKKKKDHGYINGGVYLAKKNLFDRFDLPDKFSFEEDFLKKFTLKLEIHAFISDTYFIDIGLPEDYQKAQKELRSHE